MPKPPTNLTGIEFRSADGSDDLGKAGSIYARTVKYSEKPANYYNTLPSATKIFDDLLKRKPQGDSEKVCCFHMFPL
jgi:hypothetical protein